MRITALTLLLNGLLASSGWTAECPSTPGLEVFFSEGWGVRTNNQRFQHETEIHRGNVDALKLNWVFALDEEMSPHSYPTVTEDTLFIGTGAGNVYALDRSSGCTRWVHAAGEYIRTAVVQGVLPATGDSPRQTILVFGTSNGTVHAIDAKTGAALWRTRMDDHPFTVVTGAPQFKNGKLYVPVSSVELGLAMSPFYGCCKFRGSMTRLDPATGSIQWRTYTIEEEAHKTDKHYFFVQHWGPSGAPIWSAPTVNEELGLVYSGTGENYTAPATLTSDAILAFDSEDGSLRWSRQFTSDDTFNMACNISFKHPNCPAAAGPDFDFGAPPILAQTTTGKPILLAGQKSGGVYGMNPATGELVWQQQFGRGGYLGGVHWGMAAHEDLGMLYVPISDVPAGAGEAEPEPGLHAIDIASGERRWSVQRDGNCEGRDACRTGFSAAILATEDLVFVGALDGQLYGIDTANGDILWEYDSWRDYDSVNELPTQGGAIDVHGPFVAGRQLIVQSGYGSFGQRGGNALLVFELNED